MKIKITEVWIPPNRQRTKVTEAKVAELAVSIKAHGQLHPITVVELDRVRNPDIAPHLKYELVAGYRRLLATALLKESEVDANLKADLNPLQIAEIELDENLQRENLSFQDEVNAKARLMEIRKALYGDSIRDVAAHVGESRGEFWEDVRLAKAMQIMPELAQSKNKSQAHAKLRLIARRAQMQDKAKELEKEAATPGGVGASNFSGKVKLGDCLEVVKGWADGCLHCVITDPPYGIELDVGETKRGSNHPTIYADDHHDIMDLTALVAKEAFRLLRDNSHAYFFFDIKNHAKVLKFLTEAGFNVDPIPLVWVKPGSGQTNHPESRFGNSYEACFFCRKGTRELLKPGQSNVLQHDPVPPKSKIHPVEKPLSLIRQLIESSTVKGETVADFFGGSGSLAAAALQTGRNFLVVEKDPAYHAGIIDRLEKMLSKELEKVEAPTNMDDDEADDWERAMAEKEGAQS